MEVIGMFQAKYPEPKQRLQRMQHTAYDIEVYAHVCSEGLAKGEHWTEEHRTSDKAHGGDLRTCETQYEQVVATDFDTARLKVLMLRIVGHAYRCKERCHHHAPASCDEQP